MTFLMCGSCRLIEGSTWDDDEWALVIEAVVASLDLAGYYIVISLLADCNSD